MHEIVSVKNPDLSNFQTRQASRPQLTRYCTVLRTVNKQFKLNNEIANKREESNSD